MKISAHDWVLHLCLWGVTLICSAGSLAAKTVDDGIIITDVTLISPERKTPLPHVVVVILGDRIAAIGSDHVSLFCPQTSCHMFYISGALTLCFLRKTN